MKITFLRDFRSALTNEVLYRKGETVDLEHGAALIAEGAAKAANEKQGAPDRRFDSLSKQDQEWLAKQKAETKPKPNAKTSGTK